MEQQGKAVIMPTLEQTRMQEIAQWVIWYRRGLKSYPECIDEFTESELEMFDDLNERLNVAEDDLMLRHLLFDFLSDNEA